MVARQSFLQSNTSVQALGMAERCAQAGLHFHKYSKAKLTPKAEDVRADSYSALSSVPEANCGVTPYGGAAVKTKGPAIQKDIAGHTKDVEKPVTPRGSVASATHTPVKEMTKLKVAAQTVGTQTLIPTTDAGAPQQWRAIQLSHQGCSVRLLPHRRSAEPPILHRLDTMLQAD